MNSSSTPQKHTKLDRRRGGDTKSYSSSKTDFIIRAGKTILSFRRSKLTINTGKLRALVADKRTVASGIALSLAIICNTYSDEFKEFLGDVRSVYQKIIQYIMPNHGKQTMPVVPPVEIPKKQNPQYNKPETDRKPYELKEETEPQLQHTNTDKQTIPPAPNRQEILGQLTHGFKNAARKDFYLKTYSFKKAPYPTRGQAGLVLRVQHRAAM